jgi:Tol biopolymer transport system component
METGTDELVDLAGSSLKPIWKPDGSGFAFNSLRKGDFDIYFKDLQVDGPERLILGTAADEFAVGWSADGREIFITETQPNGMYLAKVHSVDDNGYDSIVIAQADSNTFVASPDGRWLAYDSVRAGIRNIYVKPYPGTGAEVRISPDTGEQPAWSRDGKELYYLRGDAIVTVSYTVEKGRFQPGKEEVLFQSPLLASTSLGVFDDRRFVVAMLEEEPAPPSLNVVLNWSREIVERLETH